jgi:hypothetical protein
LSRKLEWLAAGALTLAGGVLRASLLDRYLDYDESFTYLRFASDSLWHAVSTYSFPNNHIFHSVLVWGTTRLFGLSMLSLRLTAFVAGVALIPLAYLLARALAGRAAAALAAALVAASPLLCDYSVTARGYTLQAALFVAALLVARKLVATPAAGPAVGTAVLLALALFTVPTLVLGAGAVFAWGALLAWEAGAGLERRLAWLTASALLTSVLTGALYLPALRFAQEHGITWGDPYELAGATLYHDLLSYWSQGTPQVLAWIVLAAVAGGALHDAIARRRVPTALAWLGVPLATLAVYLSFAPRAPFPRTFIFLVPLLLVLAASAVQQLCSRFRPDERLATVATALAAAGVLLSTAIPIRDTHRQLSLPGFPNTRYLFEQLVVPMQIHDELAVHTAQLLPMIVYARIDGIPLSLLRRRYVLGLVQRTPPDGTVAPSLTLPGQRFVLLAQPGSKNDRTKIPRALRSKLRGGSYRWSAVTRRLSAQQGPPPDLWELVHRAKR